MQKKVSIVIPVFNAENYILDCLESIKNQSYKSIEIIVVDDGSSDNTVTIVNNQINQDSRVYLYQNPKKGVSSARNFGIQQATGDFITFVDADDLIAPSMISVLCGMMSKNSCDCTSVKFTNSFNNLDLTDERGNIRSYMRKEQYKVLAEGNGYAWTKMYKLSLLKENDILFDENISIGEDILFNSQYFKISNELVESDKELYFYRLNSNSAVNRLDNYKWFDFIFVYSELLKIDMPSNIKNDIEFNYAQILMEAKHRMQYCKSVSITNDKISSLIRKYARCNSQFSIIQNLKVLIFRFFPRISMAYKRYIIKKKG